MNDDRLKIQEVEMMEEGRLSITLHLPFLKLSFVSANIDI